MRLPRYCAILGRRDPFGTKAALRERLTQAGLIPVYVASGIEVFAQGPSQMLLSDNAGVVLGPIYRREAGMPDLARSSDEESRRIRASRGQHLIDACWGDYVAVLACQGEAIVMRPPFSDLGCLTARFRGIHLAASDLDRLALCGVDTHTPVWDEVAAHLLTSGLRRAATCIEGVDELLWGSRLVIDDKAHSIEACWSPWTFTQRPLACSAAELAPQLRDLVVTCVGAQIRGFDRVDVMLSGGLDSSILAASVAQGGQSFSCLNLPFGDSAGDERIHARAVAERLGVPLHEVAPDPNEVDVARPGSPGLARPISRAFLQATRAAKLRIAAATRASAVIDGGGGDNLFCSLQSAAPVADRLLRQGPGLGMLRSAADVALLTEAGVPRVLLRAFKRAWLRKPAYRWRTDARFLTAQAIERAGAPTHRWLVAPAGAVPGSAGHIALMIVVENLLETTSGPVSEWSPLMAQPLVEFCLSIPTWLWFENGHNRAVARRAFEPLLPSEIAWRRGKGSPDGFVAQLFEANRTRLSDLLVDGLLAEQGLLDREAIRSALASEQPVKGHDYIRLLRISEVEAWARAAASAPAPLSP